MTTVAGSAEAASAAYEKIPVGISSCLLGEPVRYDGGHKQDTYISNTLGKYFELMPFCPEIDIGLGVPRQPIRLVQHAHELRCVGVQDTILDVTNALAQSADAQRGWHARLCGYILKKDSPSCGIQRVKVYRGQLSERSGRGIYAARLMQNFPELPLEEEGRLGDPALRENFIQRVFVYHRWRSLPQKPLSWTALTEFHARHKLIFMSHNQDLTRDLGRQLAASANSTEAEEFGAVYLTKLMAILKIVASRENQVNVLQHIQGYLKRHLDKEDKQELTEAIARYHQGLLPLVVPLTLLRHHFRKHPDPYIERSWYLHPYPAELMLLNEL